MATPTDGHANMWGHKVGSGQVAFVSMPNPDGANLVAVCLFTCKPGSFPPITPIPNTNMQVSMGV